MYFWKQCGMKNKKSSHDIFQQQLKLPLILWMNSAHNLLLNQNFQHCIPTALKAVFPLMWRMNPAYNILLNQNLCNRLVKRLQWTPITQISEAWPNAAATAIKKPAVDMKAHLSVEENLCLWTVMWTGSEEVGKMGSENQTHLFDKTGYCCSLFSWEDDRACEKFSISI